MLARTCVAGRVRRWPTEARTSAERLPRRVAARDARRQEPHVRSIGVRDVQLPVDVVDRTLRRTIRPEVEGHEGELVAVGRPCEPGRSPTNAEAGTYLRDDPFAGPVRANRDEQDVRRGVDITSDEAKEAET